MTPTPLSEREHDVLVGMVDGLANGAIGRRLFLSEDTVKTHARRVFRKLGVAHRTGAVIRALQLGLVEVDGLVRVDEVPKPADPGPPPEPWVMLRPTPHDAALLASAWLGDRRPVNRELVQRHAFEALGRLVGTAGTT